jgi:hypothetical protein
MQITTEQTEVQAAPKPAGSCNLPTEGQTERKYRIVLPPPQLKVKLGGSSSTVLQAT